MVYNELLEPKQKLRFLTFDIEKLKELEPPIYVAGFKAPTDEEKQIIHLDNASEIVASGKGSNLYMC